MKLTRPRVVQLAGVADRLYALDEDGIVWALDGIWQRLEKQLPIHEKEEAYARLQHAERNHRDAILAEARTPEAAAEVCCSVNAPVEERNKLTVKRQATPERRACQQAYEAVEEAQREYDAICVAVFRNEASE